MGVFMKFVLLIINIYICCSIKRQNLEGARSEGSQIVGGKRTAMHARTLLPLKMSNSKNNINLSGVTARDHTCLM